MEQNKTGKYLKYAIGEIVLVVIGILIALQINNWNEAKKNRDYEVKMLSEIAKMLSEIAKALETDKNHCENMLERINILDSTTNYFMTLSKNNMSINDSIFNKIFRLNSGTGFQINFGPYEAIKSSGLDRISNDSLRNQLIDLYDFKLPLYHENYNHVNRNHQNNIESLLSMLGNRYIRSVNGRQFVAWKNTSSIILQQQQFLEILSDIVWRNNNSNRIFINVTEELQKGIDNINLEIKDD
jgi:hypothetical protein